MLFGHIFSLTCPLLFLPLFERRLDVDCNNCLKEMLNPIQPTNQLFLREDGMNTQRVHFAMIFLSRKKKTDCETTMAVA